MIKELIYDYFKQKDKAKEANFEAKESANMAPSYFTDCPRKIFYKKTGVPVSNEIAEHSYIKFELGDATHLQVTNLMHRIAEQKKDFVWIEGEDYKETVWQGLPFIYRIDNLVENKGLKYIVEVKSIFAGGARDIEVNGPKHEHVIQLLLYMIFEHIENGILFYICRDDARMFEYHFNINALYQQEYDFIMQKLHDLKNLKMQIDAVNTGKIEYTDDDLPKRSGNICMKNNNGNISFYFQKDKNSYNSGYPCIWARGNATCQWFSKCWQKELQEIKNYKYFIGGQFE